MSRVKPLPTLDDLEVAGRKVLVRADLNVPLDGGVVVDDYRLSAAVPTIEALRQRGARVALCSHLGRPKAREEALSMRHVGPALAAAGGFQVDVAQDVAGADTARLLDQESDSVVLLENTRFEPGETANVSRACFLLLLLAVIPWAAPTATELPPATKVGSRAAIPGSTQAKDDTMSQARC